MDPSSQTTEWFCCQFLFQEVYGVYICVFIYTLFMLQLKKLKAEVMFT